MKMTIFLEAFIAGAGATLGYLTVILPISCCSYRPKSY
jgi:hypothetical protein